MHFGTLPFYGLMLHRLRQPSKGLVVPRRLPDAIWQHAVILRPPTLEKLERGATRRRYPRRPSEGNQTGRHPRRTIEGNRLKLEGGISKSKEEPLFHSKKHIVENAILARAPFNSNSRKARSRQSRRTNCAHCVCQHMDKRDM